MNKHAAKEKGRDFTPCPNNKYDASETRGVDGLLSVSTDRPTEIGFNEPLMLIYSNLIKLSTIFLDAWVFIQKTGNYLHENATSASEWCIPGEKLAGWFEYSLK